MKPTTTPGNASGKVSSAVSSERPGKRCRASSKPTSVASVSVIAVVAAASAKVATRLDR